MAIFSTLTTRETYALLNRMGGGTAGFDTRKYTLAQLHAIIQGWIDAGTGWTLAAVDALAVEIKAPAAPALPPAPPAPAALPAAPAAPSLPPGPFRLAQGVAAALGCTAEAARLAELADAAERPDAAPQPAPAALAVPSFLPQPQPQPAPVAAPALPVHTPHAAVPIAAPVVALPAAVAATLPDPAPQPAAPVVAIHAPQPGAPRMALAREIFADQAPAVLKALPAGLRLPVYSDDRAPAVNPIYTFGADTLPVALFELLAGAPTWLQGEKGTGKSAFAEQIAARLGRAYFRVNFDQNTERAEYIGSAALTAGTTIWTDGAVTMACRIPGAIILLDELTQARQGNIAFLQTVLEQRREFMIPDTGERVRIAPDVAIFAADNTGGMGDLSGRYANAHELNSALLDRFGVKLTFDYLDPAREAAVIVANTGIDEATAARIVALFGACREKAKAGALQDSPGIRRAFAFARQLSHGIPAKVAFARSVVEFSVLEGQEELQQVFAAVWTAGAAGAAAAPAAPVVNPFNA